ncbi:rhomboid family intramembrane serine protease [Nemorincola caseinilytica]|uniref:Rhomboid family intramembrane serine protease n=2 Tax=Nemorincola caseinilytica TaxID=2054315 RepID=A0ABP8NCC6_9BACT
MHGRLDDLFALHYWHSPLFRWWQLFTHMFMHGSELHIFSNMFALFMFGRVLEQSLGPRRFLMFYLICGLGAAFCHLSVLSLQFGSFHDAFVHYQQHPTLQEYAQMLQKGKVTHPVFGTILSHWSDNPTCPDCAQVSIMKLNEYFTGLINEPTVGASGAVFGLLFAFGYMYPNVELMLLFPPIPIKAKWFVAGYAVFELFAGVKNSVGDNIAHFAHLGGMLFAFILIRVWHIRRSMW